MSPNNLVCQYRALVNAQCAGMEQKFHKFPAKKHSQSKELRIYF
ncbi:hypothetical protein HMPREF0322_01175 [Desulfitobacterium hafniense DP7]|uniref:Uncharacterized protein n=1 Tax=Desulfitobacterium hafniense DP7 TaxID=537010 RepID=G9XJP4_DESHA|nr:hypothetical protein HMPREF0322_01175 [Desulfitobacterium hafniense DP7]